MGCTGPSSSLRGGSTSSSAALKQLSLQIDDAIKRRQVLVGLLRTAPHQVTEDMLNKVRTGLEEALKNIAPYLESGKVNKEKIGEIHEAVYCLYAESIERQTLDITLKQKPSDDIPTLHSHAKQLFQLLRHGQKQIFALEQALKLGVEPEFKSKVKRQLENSVAQYFVNASKQYCALQTVLTSLRGKNGPTGTKSDHRSTAIDEDQEIETYLMLLTERLNEIDLTCGIGLKCFAALDIHEYEDRDFIPLFAKWAKELHEYSLGLINLLFRKMAGEESEYRIQNSQSVLQTCFDDLFENSIYLADANDKLIKHRYKVTLPEDIKNTQAPTPEITRPTQGLAPIERINTECEETTSTSTATAPLANRKIEKLRKHLEKTPFAYFEKLKSHPTTFHPDTILTSAKQSIKVAQGLKAILERQLKDPVVAESESADLIKQKLEDIEATLTQINLAALQTDLYKAYPFPQAGHWLALFECGEIAFVELPQKLASTTEHLYEVKIAPKANSDGRQADAVYLHLHLKKKPTLKKGQSLLGTLLANPDLIEAAHLKSSFYKNKGKTWEINEQMQGRYESLVRRSPIGLDLLKAVERFYPGRT